jgi:hypothetical protein
MKILNRKRISGYMFMRLFFVFLILIPSVYGIDYYVSPDGLDTNIGTIGLPFRTIQKARDVVRTVNSSMSEDINVYLREGWYILSSAITFDQDDSGTNGYNVIYQAYSGEHVVISGGRQITGWTLHAGNIWKADAPGLETRQLYINCVRASRAHSGNLTNSLPGAVKTAEGYTTTDTNMQNWGNKGDIEFIFSGNHGGIVRGGGSGWGPTWIEARVGVDSIVGTNITMDEPAWTVINDGWSDQRTVVPTDVENAYELLDEDGEWYLDRSQDVVYYIPRSGEDMITAIVIAPVLERLVIGTGILGSPIKNIHFKNITFAHATWLVPNTSAGFPEEQACCMGCKCSYWCSHPTLADEDIYPDGNVYFRMATNVRFERCTFKHLGAEGLVLSHGSKDCMITGCVFTQISGNCIRIGHIGNPHPSDDRYKNTGNQITNCYIHDSPCEYHGGCGILVNYTANTLISHNEVCYVPYTAISFGWGWDMETNTYMQNSEMSYNYVHHYVQVMGDGGAIYTLNSQPGTVWHNNWFDNSTYQLHGGPIYPDENSSDMEIHHIVCSNVGNKWTHIWTPTVHDLNIHDIWTDTNNLLNNGTNITLENIVLISGEKSNWPLEAQSIADNAGIENTYIDIKTMPCACSVISEIPDPPSCSITSPSDGSTYTSPANITINAQASDSNGTIIKVEFYQDTTKLGEDMSSPYSYTWNNVGAGDYSLTVKAYDNDGASVVSGAVNVTVFPGDEIDARVYPNPYILSGSNPMTFSINGTTGGEVKIYTVSGKLVKKLEVEAGENEVNWDVLNEEGNSITAGLYIYCIKDGEGNNKTGKLAITQ